MAFCIQIHLISKDTQRLKRLEEDSPVKGREKKTKQNRSFNRDKRKQTRTLHDDQWIYATIGVNDHKYICPEYRNTQIHKFSMTYKETWTPHNSSGRLRYHIVNIQQINEIEN